jgi:hypothetical protein
VAIFFLELAYLALKRISFGFLALPLVWWANGVKLYAKWLFYPLFEKTIIEKIKNNDSMLEKILYLILENYL